jgi:hypothetical protein
MFYILPQYIFPFSCANEVKSFTILQCAQRKQFYNNKYIKKIK